MKLATGAAAATAAEAAAALLPDTTAGAGMRDIGGTMLLAIMLDAADATVSTAAADAAGTSCMDRS